MLAMKTLPTRSCKRTRWSRFAASMNSPKPARKMSPNRRPGSVGRPCRNSRARWFMFRTAPSASKAMRPALKVCKYSNRLWNDTRIAPLWCSRNNPFSIWTAAMETRARVCCCRELQSDDASSTPTTAPSGPNTGAAVQVRLP